MDRVRAILTTLLPAMWLAASGNSQFDCSNWDGAGGKGAANSAYDRGAYGVFDDAGCRISLSPNTCPAGELNRRLCRKLRRNVQDPAKFAIAFTTESRKSALSGHSLETAARRLHRRLRTQFSSDGLPPVLLTSYPQVPERKCPSKLFTVSEAPVGLSQGWQFHWRTALEPRAPSGLS